MTEKYRSILPLATASSIALKNRRKTDIGPVVTYGYTRLLNRPDVGPKSLMCDGVRGAEIGRHGRYRIVQIKVRGKPALRYLRHPVP